MQRCKLPGVHTYWLNRQFEQRVLQCFSMHLPKSCCVFVGLFLIPWRGKHKVVFADACHSGSLEKDQTLAMKSGYSNRLNDYYKRFKDSNGGLALLMSSKEEEYSLEDHGLRQGVFSHYLMRGLKGEANSNNDYTVSISELFDYVHKNVTRYTGNIQTPIITGKYDRDMPVAMIR